MVIDVLEHSASATIRTQARHLRESARRLEQTAGTLRQHALELEDRARELTGDHRAHDTLLRGRALGDRALAVIGDGEVHYTAIEAALTDAGYVIAGKQPAAMLLAQLAHDERFESVRPRSGLYRQTGT